MELSDFMRKEIEKSIGISVDKISQMEYSEVRKKIENKKGHKLKRKSKSKGTVSNDGNMYRESNRTSSAQKITKYIKNIFR